MKRIFDFVLAVVTLIVLGPLFIGIAVAIALSDGFPVFYAQTRIGRGFVPFTLYKFRTMRTDSDGPQITSSGDPRVTKIGRILRAWKVDELPQLLNVVSGKMALVGPRPEVGRYVERFRDDFAILLTVRPGITGEGSLMFRNESEILASADDPERCYVEDVLPRKIAIEMEYVADQSIRGDFRILVETISAIFRQENKRIE